MDQSVFYSAIAAYGAWAAVLCAMAVVWVQNRAAKRLTCLQLFVQLAAQYDSADMQQCRRRLASKLIDDTSALDLDDTVLVFYENLGLLHRKRMLDDDLVWTTFSLDVTAYWRSVGAFVDTSRSTFSDPRLYQEFERLAACFEHRDKREGNPVTPAGVRWLLEGEARRGTSE